MCFIECVQKQLHPNEWQFLLNANFFWAAIFSLHLGFHNEFFCEWNLVSTKLYVFWRLLNLLKFIVIGTIFQIVFLIKHLFDILLLFWFTCCMNLNLLCYELSKHLLFIVRNCWTDWFDVFKLGITAVCTNTCSGLIDGVTPQAFKFNLPESILFLSCMYVHIPSSSWCKLLLELLHDFFLFNLPLLLTENLLKFTLMASFDLHDIKDMIILIFAIVVNDSFCNCSQKLIILVINLLLLLLLKVSVYIKLIFWVLSFLWMFVLNHVVQKFLSPINLSQPEVYQVNNCSDEMIFGSLSNFACRNCCVFMNSESFICH